MRAVSRFSRSRVGHWNCLGCGRRCERQTKRNQVEAHRFPTNSSLSQAAPLPVDEKIHAPKLQVPEGGWDLVVCDEAHKLSATFFGGEGKYTKRYHLGQLLSGLTRHFLLMTATPT
jgi:superfamily II DNA or RNA helicase